MSRVRRLGFALGVPAFQIPETVVVSVALFYYLPPPDRGLAPQVSQEVFLGALTVFGLGMLVGRVFDSLADPLIGYFSDRSRSRLGRRRSFMLWSFAPMAALPVLLFWPPGAPGSAINAVFLAAVLVLFFVAYTGFVAPFHALIPEIASDEPSRVKLTTLIGAVTFPLIVLYNVAWPAGIEAGQSLGWSATGSVRAVAAVSGLLALALAALPTVAVDEARYANAVHSELGLREALARTVANRPFLIYLGAQMLLLFGLNAIRPLAIYYATSILGRGEGFAGILGAPILVAAPIGFAVFYRLANRIGAKRTMIICQLCFGVGALLLGLLAPAEPGGPGDGRNLVVVFTGLSIVGFVSAGIMVLPHVLISQVIDDDARRTGAHRAAIYFGVQGLATKWVYGLAVAAVAFLFARFGNSSAQPTGLILAGPMAGCASLLAAWLLTRYPERRLLGA